MATADFIMPRAPDVSHHNNFYPTQPIRAAQAPYQTRYNPQISPPSNMKKHSPTSPKGGYQPSRRPLFVPAVLRPNEFPSKEPPPRDDDESAIAPDTPTTASSFMNLPGLGSIGIGRLSRRSTSDSGRSSILEPELNMSLFPVVSAPPTRKHWKADERSTMCDEPSCTKQFGYFTRRHHCRRCGNIFCDPHSSHQVPLDEDAHFNPRGAPSRACVYCFGEFRVWHSRTSSQPSSEASSTTTRPATRASAASSSASTTASTAPNSPTAAAPASAMSSGEQQQQQQQGATPAICAGGAKKPLLLQPDAALSVPRDWNWSTF